MPDSATSRIPSQEPLPQLLRDEAGHLLCRDPDVHRAWLQFRSRRSHHDLSRSAGGLHDDRHDPRDGVDLRGSSQQPSGSAHFESYSRMRVRNYRAVSVNHIRLDETRVLTVNIECPFRRFHCNAHGFPRRPKFITRGLCSPVLH